MNNEDRILRGGAFGDPAEYVRSANRTWTNRRTISPLGTAAAPLELPYKLLHFLATSDDRLHSAKLCEFHFFPATFQGVDTSSSIQDAVLPALTAHKQKPFDALVVIRGGGSVTGLAWLNGRTAQ